MVKHGKNVLINSPIHTDLKLMAFTKGKLLKDYTEELLIRGLNQDREEL